MKRTILISLVLLLSLTASAVGGRGVKRRPCTVADVTRSGGQRALVSIPTAIRNGGWDAQRTYRLPVVLIEFSDQSFSMAKPELHYDSLFNVSGYNLGHGPGCVADYFRDQSGGLFNVQFDIIGPVKLSSSHRSNSDFNQGYSQVQQALRSCGSQLDNAAYDWDGDAYLELVIVVYAGVGGNEDSEESTGCMWPTTMSISGTTPAGFRLTTFSSSAERWSTGGSCGIGTICHEFSHWLGLPDFYPTSEDGEYTVLDEWDLMDGGNFCDDGWCPPNYSVHEKDFLGWATPEELTRTTTVSGMKSTHEGGRGYRIRPDLMNDADEYYLLENRQQEGWDYYLPGHGLLVTHIDFKSSSWSGNTVNADKKHYRINYVTADNRHYADYEAIFTKTGRRDTDGRCFWLSEIAYPYVSDQLTNRELTDTSTPASTLFNANRDGQYLLSKPLMDIYENEGHVSFFFADNNTYVGVTLPQQETADGDAAVYDLMGRRLQGTAPRPGIYLSKGKKYIIKQKK